MRSDRVIQIKPDAPSFARELRNFEGTGRSYVYLEYPETCPLCHSVAHPTLLKASQISPRNEASSNEILFAFYLCPSCVGAYLGKYSADSTANHKNVLWKLEFFAPVMPETETFSEMIQHVSDDFVKIHSQAETAEAHGLDEVSGIGYRRALEFLLKDFLISEKPDKKEDIEKRTLSQCITEYIDDRSLKITASRAAWLGNDFTHYRKKFVDKDIADLKRLIHISVRHIENILETREAEKIEPIK